MNNVTTEQLNTKPSRRPMLDIDKINESKNAYRILKRIQDILVSLIGIIALLPVFIIISIIVFIECPTASPIFVQKRVGKNGKHFNFLKFRSMVPDAEDRLEELLDQNEMEGHAFKMKNDPRITKVGRILRKTSLDELPQLFNVLVGNMSLVGPRPPIPREVANYDEYQLQRLLATPGITCYWQTLPNRNDMTFDEWLEMDLDYIEDRSFKTDYTIIISTVFAVLGMNGI